MDCGMSKGLNNQEPTLCFQTNCYSMLVILTFLVDHHEVKLRLRMTLTSLSVK